MSKRKQTPQGRAPDPAKTSAQTSRAAGRYVLTAPDGAKDLTLSRGRQAFSMHKSALADQRREQRDLSLARSQEIAERGVRRRFLKRQREVERGIKAYWAMARIKVRLRPAKAGARPRTIKLRLGRLIRLRGIRLASYRGPIIDSRGRRGVFQTVEYYGARRTRFGVGKRMVAYVTRDDGVELDAEGDAVCISNVGETSSEMGCAFELIEVANRTARGNAKVMLSMIVGLPHDVPIEARRKILERVCEEAFGLFDLPYCAALHKPSGEGDQRSHHAHVLFSFRPMRRTGDHEWEVGRELLTEHDRKERFFELRKLFAEIMTEVVQDHGKTRREYTHLSNTARGLKAEPQENLNAALIAIVRRGGEVDRNERNRERVEEGEKLMAADRSVRRLANPKAVLNRVLRKVERLRIPAPARLGAIARLSMPILPQRAPKAAPLAISVPGSLPLSPIARAVSYLPPRMTTLPAPVSRNGLIALNHLSGLNQHFARSLGTMTGVTVAPDALSSQIGLSAKLTLPPPTSAKPALMTMPAALPSSGGFPFPMTRAFSIDLPASATRSSDRAQDAIQAATTVAPVETAQLRMSDRLLELLALFAAHKDKTERARVEKEKARRAAILQSQANQWPSR